MEFTFLSTKFKMPVQTFANKYDIILFYLITVSEKRVFKRQIRHVNLKCFFLFFFRINTRIKWF